jgi:hypothetical protein
MDFFPWIFMNVDECGVKDDEDKDEEEIEG